ncbi:hypothetical protein STAS_08072 [Striga asiatica]|uniref:Uncharacterized protein n=1 Tax=Striga asiatica TaxID=4170 RepID=A0A5A7PI92_STRAF|nr:hypothetical protein STAS_08072 [Striga asiatica]
MVRIKRMSFKSKSPPRSNDESLPKSPPTLPSASKSANPSPLKEPPSSASNPVNPSPEYSTATQTPPTTSPSSTAPSISPSTIPSKSAAGKVKSRSMKLPAATESSEPAPPRSRVQQLSRQPKHPLRLVPLEQRRHTRRMGAYTHPDAPTFIDLTVRRPKKGSEPSTTKAPATHSQQKSTCPTMAGVSSSKSRTHVGAAPPSTQPATSKKQPAGTSRTRAAPTVQNAAIQAPTNATESPAKDPTPPGTRKSPQTVFGTTAKRTRASNELGQEHHRPGNRPRLPES